MKKFYNLKLFLMTLFVALAGTVSAQTEVAFNPSSNGFSTSAGSVSATVSGITIACTNGVGTSSQYRFYASSTTTITSTVGKITKVVFTCTASGTNNYGSGNFSVPSGSAGSYSNSGTTGTWEGETESITLSASKQVRATKIVVTYTPKEGSKSDPGLSFSPASVTMTIGETFTAPTLTNDNGVTVTYASSDEDVATVDENTGAVTVLAAGSTQITATSTETDDYQVGIAAYTLTVNKINPALAFSEGSVSLTYGETFTAPTLTNDKGVTVTYGSSNTSVATVNETTGEVTIVGAGNATITASSEEDATHSAGTASYNITVLSASEHVYWSEDWSSGEIDSKYSTENGGGTTKLYNEKLAGGTAPEILIGKSGGSLTYATIDVEGHTGTLTLSLKENYDRIAVTSATTGVTVTKGTFADNACTWTISVPETVSTLSLTLSNANANVRVDDIYLTGDYSAVTLEDAGLEYSAETATVTLGEEPYTLPTFSNPNSLDVTFTSTNEDVATVDANGNVTIVGAGTTTIKATSEKDDTYKAGEASYTLTVESNVVVNTTTVTFWSEDWSSAEKDQTPTEVDSKYTYTDGGSATKIYEESTAGSESPEILISKSGGSLTYDAINIAGHTGTLTLTYISNNTNATLTSATEGVTLTKVSHTNKEKTVWTITVPTSTTTLSLTLSNSNSGNTRIDDILLTGEVLDLGNGSFAITGAGYSTYFTDQAFIMPTGAQGATISEVGTPNSNGISKVTANWKYTAGSIVPANEALLLKGDANTYNYTITSTTAAATTGNLLQGSTTDVLTTGGTKYYMLSYGEEGTANEDVLGFYYGEDDGAAFTSEANKCWIALDGAAGVRGLVFDFNDDDVTGINSVGTAADGVKAIFDLQGRRVVTPKAGNIYIVNGKKVLVK